MSATGSHLEASHLQGYVHVEPYTERSLTGWVADLAQPGAVFRVEFLLNGHVIGETVADRYRADLRFDSRFTGHNGFAFEVPASAATARSFILRARVAGTNRDLQGSPILSLATPRLARAAQSVTAAFQFLEQKAIWGEGGWSAADRSRFVEILFARAEAAELIELARRYLQTMPGKIGEDYARRHLAHLTGQVGSSTPRRSRGAHRDRAPAVLRTEEATAEALAACSDRDICLVDADVELSGDWLERLQAAAYSHPEVGAAAPLSDCGSFATYPLPPEFSPADWDAVCRSRFSGKTIDLPAWPGGCVYIRRGCLDEVEGGGPLLAQRAAARGWRSVLALDVFAHAERGRDPETLPLMYQDMITDFRVDDPLATARRNLDVARIRQSRRPVTLLITHRYGGGVERRVREVAGEITSQGWEALILFPLAGGGAAIHSTVLPEIALHYRPDREPDSMVKDLRALDVRRVEIHSNVSIPGEFLVLPRALGIPYECVIHDYSWFCPRVNLVDGSRSYCGEPPVHVCEECVLRNGLTVWNDFGTQYASVGALVESSRSLLVDAESVTCPSRDTLRRMEKHFTLTNLRVGAHEDVRLGKASSTRRGAGRVVTMGRLSVHKGMDVILACARRAAAGGIGLTFVILGQTEDDGAFAALPNVSVSGAYREEDGEALIRGSGAAVAFFASVWPETFSYTLSLALRCGLYPVAFDLGAIAERMRDAGTGRLLPLGTPADEINAALLEATRSRSS